MSVTYNATIKTNRMIQVRDGIDGAATPGKLRIGTAGMAVTILEVALSDPCGIVSGSQLTFSGLPVTQNATNTGLIAEAQFLNGDDVVQISGLTVGVADSDILVNNVNANAGQPITVNPTTLNHG